ncbi:ribonuclease P protein component [Leptothrix discophora]|uniref:Ribonuclease P protein component n=1 Tax=Leptothrix discophora TaxID=89 RepID=A0ABT9G3Z0_LEPDI|nr:ribonuclease P protein component [Leptothrix discophora]MDP4301121.1 ribonuclease P protein component [Leptothrix discophora]
MLCSLDGAKRFQAVLATRPCSKSAHFMLHYRAVDKLSTAPPVGVGRLVDDFGGRPVPVSLGLVVPKRHARRAVTRNLVRREARAQMTQRADHLPPGDWVLRLRAPFDRSTFSSAASAALLLVVREEITRLIADGLRAVAKASARASVPLPLPVPAPASGLST